MELEIPNDSPINQFSRPADTSPFSTTDSCHILHPPLAPDFVLSPTDDSDVSLGVPLEESPTLPPALLVSSPATTSGEKKMSKERDDNSDNSFTVASLEELQKAASTRWLLPTEILYVLTKWNDIGLRESTTPPKYPTNGDIFLFDKTRTKNFRDDGVKWVMKKGTTYQRVREDFVKFTATNGELVLTGFYTYSQEDTSFKRRCYKKSIEGCTQYFVHYRKYSEDENYRIRRKEKSKKAQKTNLPRGESACDRN